MSDYIEYYSEEECGHGMLGNDNYWKDYYYEELQQNNYDDHYTTEADYEQQQYNYVNQARRQESGRNSVLHLFYHDGEKWNLRPGWMEDWSGVEDSEYLYSLTS